jgi:hypothetical protein
MKASQRNLPIVAALLIGIGMIAAPIVFQMFDRAPLGGEMIDDFEPYMTIDEVESFRGYLAEIGAADLESINELRPDLVDAGVIDEDAFDTTFVSLANLNEQWPTIQDDMGDLIDRMEVNLDNYAAVAALPPFPMFPWFFVIPGLMIVAAATVALVKRRDGHVGRGRPAVWTLLVLGVAVAAAPVMFQMFDRAPKGAEMIDDFRPMMTRDRVQAVQGYFVTLGAAEGQLRVNVLPMLVEAGGDPADYPAISQWSADWPTILTDFNPMVATMSDNVDNYQAVDALPSFDLFPWFFVIPGVLVAGLAGLALRKHVDSATPPQVPLEASPQAPPPDQSLVEASTAPTSPSTV